MTDTDTSPAVPTSAETLPKGKREYYRNTTIDSVKQHLMMKLQPWDTAAISKHYDDMKTVLLKSLAAGVSGEGVTKAIDV